jgi:Helix-turn-helix domain
MENKEFFKNANDITDFALDGTSKKNTLKVTSNHGFTIAPQKIIRCFRMRELEKIVLLELFSYIGRSGYAFPSHNYLALKLGKKSTSSVKSALKSLREKGFIDWSHGGGDFGTNHYYITDLTKSPYIILSEATHYFIKEVLRDYRNRISYVKLYGTILDYVEKPKSEINTDQDHYGLVMQHLEKYPQEREFPEFYSTFLTCLNNEIYNKTSFLIDIDWKARTIELFSKHFPELISEGGSPSLLEKMFVDLWERERERRFIY